MGYIVTQEDLKKDIAGFPIEVIQLAIRRAKEQGISETMALESLQYCRTGGFRWDCTAEGYAFWQMAMKHKDFSRFFEVYPKSFDDGVFYAAVVGSPTAAINKVIVYRNCTNNLAYKGKCGDIYYIVKKGDEYKIRFALKDSPRYRWVIENGTEVK
jgi:hypothetical protein